MPLSLTSATALVRGDRLPPVPDDDRDAIQRDILGPFGVRPDPARLARAANVGFTELAENLVRELPISGPDLLIFAYGIPDPSSLKHVTPYVNHLLGDRSHSFAISEQGLRAPYTALKIADAYARSGRCGSLALFVCEQNSLPYHDSFVADNRLANTAALFLFGDCGGGYEFVATGPTSTTRGLGPLLGSVTARCDPDSTLVVAGPWVDADMLAATGVPTHRVAPGSYCTGVWLELARSHRTWATTYRTLVLCDTDPRTGRSQTALLRRRSTTGAVAPGAPQTATGAPARPAAAPTSASAREQTP
ncbi:hypothetical protein [Micromonospora humida]|uniref:Beta-ketoacyl synthase N-terminal domain-containing protein n=1 Tax=Micromonospora humida TaxID=2809018 RepID=A0ABS2ITD4_9ACTN|nr:hypothetical protein [Micromonospora humida]MBM7077231.1 hypothetical protein [Micromonospora humida]